MTPRSSTLFHFTRNRDTLKLILSGGFWPRYCTEDLRWLAEENAESIAFPMVCFCDIPLSRIAEHVNFYGQYGLGMTREWATANSLNPVFYVSGENPVCHELRMLNSYADHFEAKDRDKVYSSLRYLYAHVKPSSGVMWVNGNQHPKDFYLESEWRHVPRTTAIEDYLNSRSFESPEILKQHNQASKEHCSLKFTPKDVKYIFVKSDADIPDLINFIQTSMDHYPHADTKVLMSRVTSLESIQADL